MNAVPPPPTPDDEAADPLLAALRQHLAGYGQAPPPGAWAAIRRQVAPAALPQPWWRHRHLLVVLGLLLGGLLLPGRLGEWPGLRRTTEPLIADNQLLATQSASRLSPAHASAGVTPHRAASTPTAGKTTSPGFAKRRLASSLPAATDAAAVRPEAAKTAAAPVVSRAATSLLDVQKRVISVGDTRALSSSGHAAAAGTSRASRRPPSTVVAAGEGSRVRARRPNRWPAAALTKPGARAGRSGIVNPVEAARSARQLASRTRRSRAAAGAWHPATAPDAAFGLATRLAVARNLASRQRAHHAKQTPGNSKTRASRADSAAAEASAAAGASEALLPGFLYPAGPLGLLAPKLASLPFPAAVPLAALVSRPDSTPPAPPVRRWALLLLAGPTVSYRTLGPAPMLAAGHPDFARLERPALGLGAQVQARRVLSGRWALAVGVGYHEYATRLALNLRDTLSLHQRDSYRLLTVPVQLSYALGAPKGRLSQALLLGAEPGWYLGGRSTEGSGCRCEQQTYTSAASSPYRSLSVAFSLGLDLRYRLGGAGARWQWLVQPTGRYVATPFVRSEAIGFTQRQPFSLGLLTGFSWDVR